MPFAALTMPIQRVWRLAGVQGPGWERRGGEACRLLPDMLPDGLRSDSGGSRADLTY
jgi:hypothetical protein